MSNIIVEVSTNDSISAVVAFSIVAIALFWTSYKFNESTNVFIGMLSQVFHGFAMIMLLGILYLAYLYGGSAAETITAPILGIFGLLLFVYAMILIMRNVFGIIKACYDMVIHYMKGSRGGSLKIEGGVGVEDTRR